MSGAIVKLYARVSLMSKGIKKDGASGKVRSPRRLQQSRDKQNSAKDQSNREGGQALK